MKHPLSFLTSMKGPPKELRSPTSARGLTGVQVRDWSMEDISKHPIALHHSWKQEDSKSSINKV